MRAVLNLRYYPGRAINPTKDRSETSAGQTPGYFTLELLLQPSKQFWYQKKPRQTSCQYVHIYWFRPWLNCRCCLFRRPLLSDNVDSSCRPRNHIRTSHSIRAQRQTCHFFDSSLSTRLFGIKTCGRVTASSEVSCASKIRLPTS